MERHRSHDYNTHHRLAAHRALILCTLPSQNNLSTEQALWKHSNQTRMLHIIVNKHCSSSKSGCKAVPGVKISPMARGFQDIYDIRYIHCYEF